MLCPSVLARPGALLRATGVSTRRFQVTFSPRHTYTELTRWVMPSYTNKCGVARGGKIMAWIGARLERGVRACQQLFT